MPFLLGLGVSLGLFALYVSTRPAAFRITRARTIPAPPSTVYGLINDFRAWAEWSPWEKLDPAMKKTYDGPPAGVGTHYHWAGAKAGEGSMTIAQSVADERIEIDLNFVKPFAANNKTTFTFEPEANGTRVTWTMEGNSNFMSKAFGVFVNMDKMIGKDFDSGLDAMSTIASRAA